MRTRWFCLAVLIAAASLASPVFGGVADAAPKCKVLKTSEVNKVVGATAKPGAKPPGLGGECAWVVPSDSAGQLYVWVLKGDQAKAGYDNGKQLAGKDVENVSGIGDKAFYTGKTFATLYALKGDTLVYLQYYKLIDDTPAKTKKITETLTKKVLKRV